MGHNLDAKAAFYDYKDAELSVRLPRYLKPKKGIRYFGRPGKAQKQPGITGLGIQLVDAAGAGVIIESMRDAARTVSEPDVQYRVIQAGAIRENDGSLELLASTRIPAKDECIHQYDAVCVLSNQYISMSFVGRGEIAEFAELCRSIVASVRIGHVRM